MRFRFFSPALALVSVCCASAFAQRYMITTIAGNNSAGYSGDNGPATSAQLNQPIGIAVDSSGNIYIADSGNHCVRKISNGTITTVAGTGTAGYAGDKAAANKAQLNNPAGVAVDASGNLYIADSVNNVIREVSSGTITTIVGNASLGAGYAGDSGAATSAQMSNPVSVAVDSSGNLFIADSNNNVIRKVTQGAIFTLVGGSATSGQLSHPDSVVLDSNGDQIIADTVGRRIVEFSYGAFNVLAGNQSFGFSGDNGLATQASLYDPMGVALDAAGNIYIADTINSRIRVISASTGIITTIAGTGYPGYYGDNGPATQAWLYFPRSLAVDASGNIYISDSFNNVVRMLTPVAAATANAVVNAASFTPQVSPGSLATLFGTHLGGGLVTAGAPLPTSLSGVSITVNGKAAPILAVNASQVNFQIPWETSPGSAQVIVSVNGAPANTLTVPVLAAAPGIFLEPAGRAAAQNSDYSLNTSGNPAKIGGTIIAYLTGSGPVNISEPDGIAAAFSPLATAMSQASATIGSVPAEISFAGLAPGFVGLTQINIVVPPGLAPGDYPLIVTINGTPSNAGIISVSQ